MSSYYDLEQILRLQGVMGSDVEAIVTPLLASMTEAVDEVQTATAAGDLDRVTRAAHRCRNDAMVLGAHQLLRALTSLEDASRDYDEARVAEALARVCEIWPPTRDELVSLTNPP
jgi:HPt (histidine-containing phosphotransfer) domain-containing protein